MTVPIERLAAGGDGVGKAPTGKVVFVSRTCPGDVAEVEITQEKARHAHAKVLSLKVRGAERVVPECAHYTDDRCGGCQWQHVSFTALQSFRGPAITSWCSTAIENSCPTEVLDMEV